MPKAETPCPFAESSKPDRKLWIVRVPPHVAERWREAYHSAAVLQAGAEAGEHDTTIQDAGAPILGRLQLEEGNPTTLTVLAPDGGSEVLYMNEGRDTVATAVLSFGRDQQQQIVNAKAEGSVSKRFDAAPVKLSGGSRGPANPTADQPGAAATGQVDASYLDRFRKRMAATAAAKGEKRKVSIIEDEKTMNDLEAGLAHAPLYVKNRQAKKPVAAGTDSSKRKKLTKDELEEQLFILFGQQQHWHFTQLQKTLAQPVTAIKEILIQIADQVKRGPNKDLWELRPQYKKAPGQQQGPARAAV